MMQLVLMLAVLGAPEEGRSEPPAPEVTAEQFAQASPEHKVALLDARRWVPAADPRVSRARALLSRVDALYVEDAARIVALTELFWREIRSEGHEASATEILQGATAWRDPPYFEGGRRQFEGYVVLYATLRIGRAGRPGLLHAEAVRAMRAAGRGEDAKMRRRRVDATLPAEVWQITVTPVISDASPQIASL